MLKTPGFILLSLLTIQFAAAADNVALWLNLTSSSSRHLTQFRDLLLSRVEADNIFQIKSSDLSPETLTSRLQSLNRQQQSKQLVFINCSMEDYAKLLKNPEARSLLSDLQIELMTGRLMGLPLHLYGYAESKRSLQVKISGLSSVQIAFLTLPLEEIYSVEEADLLTMFSEILAKPKNSIRIYREREAYTAARQLFEGHYNLVAIYEDDPSSLVNEFRINLVEELNAPDIQMLPLEASRVNYHLNEISPQRFKYVFFLNQDDPVTPIPAIVQKTGYNFPVLLSNIRSGFVDSQPGFAKALSDAYFLMVSETSRLRFENESEKQSVQRMYALNACLNDPSNKYKSLAFLGYLLLMKDRKWNNAQAKAIYDQKCALFQKTLKLSRITAGSLFEWLDLQVPQIEKRELFTDDVSRLYQNALNKIDEGLRSDKEKKKAAFEAARRFLIAALLHGEEPKNVKGSRGLWSIKDYNPYYQLARVTLYLEDEK